MLLLLLLCHVSAHSKFKRKRGYVHHLCTHIREHPRTRQFRCLSLNHAPRAVFVPDTQRGPQNARRAMDAGSWLFGVPFVCVNQPKNTRRAVAV